MYANKNINNLECSSAGDKRFSALYARVKYEGKYQSIESIYQGSKRFYNNIENPKGRFPDYIEFGGKILDAKHLKGLYYSLWYIYLQENLELVDYAKKFTHFTDSFRGNSVNCQADCVKEYVQLGGKEYYEKYCKEFFEIFIGCD